MENFVKGDTIGFVKLFEQHPHLKGNEKGFILDIKKPWEVYNEIPVYSGSMNVYYFCFFKKYGDLITNRPFCLDSSRMHIKRIILTEKIQNNKNF